MVNNKGLIRIVEATIAIVVIVGFLILAQVRIRDVDEASFSSRVQSILEEVSKDAEIRDAIYEVDLGNTGKVSVRDGEIYSFVDTRIQESLEFQIRICDDIDQICSLEEFVEGDIFADERVIVPSVERPEELNARKIALFVYRQ